MKKLLLLVMSLCAAAVLLPARADAPEKVVVTSKDLYTDSLAVSDADFTAWLYGLLNTGDPCAALPYVGYEYRLVFSPGGADEAVYTVQDTYGDDGACVIRPGGERCTLSQDTAKMLRELCLGKAIFAIPDAHRDLLAGYGWTVAFRHPCMPTALPAQLAISRGDMSSLYFTYAEVFLRGGGYDITPWLGQAVVPYVYALHERVHPSVWEPDTTDTSAETVCAVVLECRGEVIGAYIVQAFGNGEHMLSIDGKAPGLLLEGMSIREFLLSRLVLTEEDCRLAALPKEEIARLFGETRSTALMDIQTLLRQGQDVYSSVLYAPVGLALHDTGANVVSVEDFPVEDDDGVCLVRWKDGTSYFPHMILESPQTGWKIISYFNTMW